jgi:hypothetical protein
MVVAGLLGDRDNPEFASARTSKNDFPVLADGYGIGGKKNFAAVVAEIGSRH